MNIFTHQPTKEKKDIFALTCFVQPTNTPLISHFLKSSYHFSHSPFLHLQNLTFIIVKGPHPPSPTSFPKTTDTPISHPNSTIEQPFYSLFFQTNKIFNMALTKLVKKQKNKCDFSFFFTLECQTK